MNIVLRINRANMDAYSDPAALRSGWALTHLGNGDVPDEAVIAARPEVLIVDAVTPVTAELIGKLPELKLIHSQGVAFDKIDCAAARERGVYVCNNLMYGLLQAIAEEPVFRDVKGGFIHVPASTDMLPEIPEGTPVMDKADIVKGLTVAVAETAKALA